MDYFERGSSTGMAAVHRVRTLSCAEQYRSMAFAQLTYRESLRDIERVSVHASKPITWASEPVRRSTLADANERRDWRIHAALASGLQARTLVWPSTKNWGWPDQYRPCFSTTIALSLTVFPVGAFRTAAVKHAHAAHPGQHSEFFPSGWRRTFMPSSRCSAAPEPSAVATSDFARL